MASVGTLARGWVDLTFGEFPAQYRAEGIRAARKVVPYAVDLLLIGQGFDASRNQVLTTLVGDYPGDVPLIIAVDSVIFGGDVGLRIAAAFVPPASNEIRVYFQVLEIIDADPVDLPNGAIVPPPPPPPSPVD